MSVPFNVAVVIPVYNRETIVLKTLDSVVRQTVAPKRLIIVDDGSTDDTVACVRRWIADHRLSETVVSVIEQQNQGAASARNRGLEVAADCDYFAFLDSDDQWPDDFIARIQTAFKQHPAAVAATTDRLFVRPSSQKDRLRSSAKIADNSTAWLLLNDSGIGSCTVFAAGPVRELGGYDADVTTGHDTKLFLPVSTFGDWLYVSGTPVQFAVIDTNTTAEAMNLSRSIPRRELIRVKLRQEFLRTEKGKQSVNQQTTRRCMARRWYKAGREAMQLGDQRAATEHFEKTIAWNPLHIRAYVGLLKARTKIVLSGKSKVNESPDRQLVS